MFCNTSTPGHSTFLLTGFPGLEASHHWVSIPINLICVVSILGNSVILFLIRTDPALHEPMFIFLSMLAASDLGLCASTFPLLGVSARATIIDFLKPYPSQVSGMS